MTDRERFINCILGEPVDRPPFWLMWGPWGTAWQRWEREGKPAEITDHRSFWQPDAVPHVVPVKVGPCPVFDTAVVEENEHTFIFHDTWGIKRRDIKGSMSMPEFLEFPVKNRRDWEQYKEEHLDPAHPDRLAGDWLAQARAWEAAEVPIQLGNYPDTGLFGGLRWLLGDEECLYAFCMQPDLVHDIMEHLTEVCLAVWSRVVTEVRVDVIHIWEDMCGRSGPLIGPDQWREFMGPGYRRIKAFADEHNIPIISVDTDGMPDPIIPPMIEAGVNMLFPFEVAAGCDVNDFRKRYPALGMMGGIDKRALADSPEAIDRELERIRPAMETGRYIPELDHLVPDDVSWVNYSHYCEALKRLVGAG